MDIRLNHQIVVGEGGRIDITFPDLKKGDVVKLVITKIEVDSAARADRIRNAFGSLKGKIKIADDFNGSASNRKPGSARDQVSMAEDCDEALEDFRDYM